MDDLQARRIAERHLEAGERIVWSGASATRSYALRYVPGNLLALVFTAVFTKMWFIDNPGPLKPFHWLFITLIVTGLIGGIRTILLEMDVHWAVTNHRIMRIRRNGVRTFTAGDLETLRMKGKSLVIGVGGKAVTDDEAKRIVMMALSQPQKAHAAVNDLMVKNAAA